MNLSMDVSDDVSGDANEQSAARVVPPSPFGGALSGFVRDAIREKAARELSALRVSLDAFAHLLSVQGALGSASGDLTALLGGLSAIGADGGTIGRAKKLRKLLDEARDAADALVEATGVAQRRVEAEEKKRMLLRELEQAGVTLDEGC